MKLEYGKIIGISEKTTLAEAREYGELFADELRRFVKEGDWVTVMQFLWDAQIMQQLGDFCQSLKDCNCVDDAANNKPLMARMRSTRSSFTMMYYMLRSLIGDKKALDAAQIEYNAQIYRVMSMTKKMQSKELLGNCAFNLTMHALNDFIAYVIYFTGDPESFRNCLSKKAIREIERGNIKRNPGAGVIMFYSACKMYLEMLEKVFIPRLVSLEEQERIKKAVANRSNLTSNDVKKIDCPSTNSKFKDACNAKETGKIAFSENGFKNSPFAVLKK